MSRVKVPDKFRRLYDTLGSTGGSIGTVAWTDITGKPTTFDPVAHTHPTSDVTGLDTALSGKAATVHTHITSDVTGLDTALSGKQATLVSATNIKTINGSSILGAGDLVVSGSGGSPIISWII